jgi:hypothetical protein
MVEETKKSPKELVTMAQALKDMQAQLEPVRDKALDQKLFYTGYAQCAENFIKIIVDRANALATQAVESNAPTEGASTEQLIADKFKDVEVPEDESTGDTVEGSSSPE